MNEFNFTEDGYIPPPQTAYDFYFGEHTPIHPILPGISNDFVAVWANPDASLYTGKMYASSSEAFYVINLADVIVEDYYTETRAGEAGEVLQGDDIVDINVP